MQDKRLTIINEATSLFSQKGFHATSMQEVADNSHISKGTIYTYFESKEALLLSIFKYFQETIQDHLRQAASASGLSKKERFVQLIKILMSESLRYKSFFKMQHREQIIASNKTIQAYLMESRINLFEWYESILLELYGKDLQPYITESGILLDSLITGFLRVLMIDEDNVKIDQIALYIAKRLDSMLPDMIKEAEPPLLPETFFNQFRSNLLMKHLEQVTDIQELFNKMETIINQLKLETDQKQELLNSLSYLKKEYSQDSTKKFLFKALLSNFNTVPELSAFQKRLEVLLELS